MADIAISQLTYGLPSSTASIPFSQDGNTLRVTISGLLVNAGLTLNNNGGNIINNGLILSGSPLYNDVSYNSDAGIVSHNVARGFYQSSNTEIQTPVYVHILLPSDFNNTQNQMFLLEIKGYNFTSVSNVASLLNLMIGGYVTTVSNGGPIRKVASWSAQGDFAPTAYYSSAYNRGIARFYVANPYYTSFAVNSICVGNGRLIKPGELQIIYSTSATI